MKKNDFEELFTKLQKEEEKRKEMIAFQIQKGCNKCSQWDSYWGCDKCERV